VDERRNKGISILGNRILERTFARETLSHQVDPLSPSLSLFLLLQDILMVVILFECIASHCVNRFSALYVVDLERLRASGVGDTLRSQYMLLSQDPDSLANLDQVIFIAVLL
jgi:hypothetical protein